MRRFSKYRTRVLAGASLAGSIIIFYGWPTHSDLLVIPVRSERPCIPLVESAAVIVVLGQSNAGNFGADRYKAMEAVDNFDPESGKCFAATDPLLGADGLGASFATRLGDILIQSGQFKRVIIAPMAIGGASISQLNSTYTPFTS